MKFLRSSELWFIHSDPFIALIHSFLNFFRFSGSVNLVWYITCYSYLFEWDLIIFFLCMYGFPSHDNLRKSMVNISKWTENHVGETTYACKSFPRGTVLLFNYTLHEIALVLPHKQQATILWLPVVCNCPRSRPLLVGNQPRRVAILLLLQNGWKLGQFALKDEILELKHKHRLLRAWQFNVWRSWKRNVFTTSTWSSI